MKRAQVLALAAVCAFAAPAAAQYMPGTQERISHWATRTYWPGHRHHWPGYGYGGRGFGVQPPMDYRETTVPVTRNDWRTGVGYRALYKPRHSKNRTTAERQRPAATRR